ncbi:hypothetical protein [Roseateles sp.]|uniref:hypothetical protein n=1 Tax=Roseateles sp. TaxID=1971397 RepID=UPI0031D6362C
MARLLAAALTVCAISAGWMGAAIAQQKPYVPPPPPKPTAVAPKGDFTAGLPAQDPQTAADANSDEAFRAKAEAAAIQRSGLSVKRAGARLILPTASGRPVVFDSVIGAASDANGETYQDYRFDGLSPDREFYVVSATFHEASDLYWVSRQDGTRYAVHSRPQPSPDGSLLVVANGSAGRDFNGILVWERATGRLIERFRLEPEGAQYGFYRVMRWKDNRSIELERLVVDGTTCDGGTGEQLVMLVRESNQWTLKEQTALLCRR